MDSLNSSPTRTRLLPYPWDTYFYPEGSNTMKRSRTKNMEKRRMNEERWSDDFFLIVVIIFPATFRIFRKNPIFMLINYKYYILEEQWNYWWPRSQICYDSMYVKIDGQFKTIKRIELTPDSKTFLLHIGSETGKEKVYNCPSGSPN